MTTDELVNVLVPKRHLSRVYGLIAELDSDSTPSVEPKKGLSGDNGSSRYSERVLDEWTPKRIRRMVEESPPAMRDILRALGSRSDEWLTTDELAAAIESKKKADWNTVAGTLGAFARRVKSRYALETLPFMKRYDHEAHCKMHRMSNAIAVEVRRCLENGD